MTNLEWLKTLSAEELADWLYDEWLHHLQYRWSSSRGGLIIWLKDCKDEPTGYNLSPVDKDINVRSKYEPLTCRNKDHYADCEYKDNCNPVVCFKALDEFREMVTEPQSGKE